MKQPFFFHKKKIISSCFGGVLHIKFIHIIIDDNWCGSSSAGSLCFK